MNQIISKLPQILLTLLLASLLALLAKFLFKRAALHSRLNYPVAATRIPLIGPAIEFGTDGLGFLQRQKEKLGRVFLVDLLVLRFHFALGSRATAAIYKAPKEELSFLDGVPPLLPELVEDAWDLDPSFQAKGHAYIIKGFGQKERLDHALTILIEEIDKITRRWVGLDKVDIFAEASRLTVLVTLRFIVGDDVYNEKGETMANLYDQLEKDLADPLVMTMRPLPTAPYRRVIRNRNLLLEIMREAVDKKIKGGERTTGEKEEDKSFLKFLVDELGPEHWYQYGYLCLGIILATRTNTAGVLAWTLAHWCDNPEYMKKAVDELEEHGCMEEGVGGIGEPAYPVKEFKFIDACMKETIRSYSNFMQFRMVMKKGGFEIEPGVFVPQGELLCFSPAESHHDEEYFEDPFVYKPERWLLPDYWASRSREMQFVQWGFLKGRCYGEKFAQQFDKVSWARIISKFKMEAACEQKFPEPLWGSGFGTSFAKDNQPYWVKVSPRD